MHHAAVCIRHTSADSVRRRCPGVQVHVLGHKEGDGIVGHPVHHVLHHSCNVGSLVLSGICHPQQLWQLDQQATQVLGAVHTAGSPAICERLLRLRPLRPVQQHRLQALVKVGHQAQGHLLLVLTAAALLMGLCAVPLQQLSHCGATRQGHELGVLHHGIVVVQQLLLQDGGDVQVQVHTRALLHGNVHDVPLPLELFLQSHALTRVSQGCVVASGALGQACLLNPFVVLLVPTRVMQEVVP
mmetsp:Transcript_13654/g.29290  ORF Transcript_13654/g.29290 Transcript_13654/m.29290 type:complete len:242 (-) Transcript_13654:315-1040(-)